MKNNTFNPNNCTEKELPTLTLLFDNLMSGDWNSNWSEQRNELIEKNEEIRCKRQDIFKALSQEQRDIINADDEVEADLHYMELSEKFCAGFKLGAMLMKELLG